MKSIHSQIQKSQQVTRTKHEGNTSRYIVLQVTGGENSDRENPRTDLTNKRHIMVSARRGGSHL